MKNSGSLTVDGEQLMKRSMWSTVDDLEWIKEIRWGTLLEKKGY